MQRKYLGGLCQLVPEAHPDPVVHVKRPLVVCQHLPGAAGRPQSAGSTRAEGMLGEPAVAVEPFLREAAPLRRPKSSPATHSNARSGWVEFLLSALEASAGRGCKSGRSRRAAAASHAAKLLPARVVKQRSAYLRMLWENKVKTREASEQRNNSRAELHPP